MWTIVFLAFFLFPPYPPFPLITICSSSLLHFLSSEECSCSLWSGPRWGYGDKKPVGSQPLFIAFLTIGSQGGVPMPISPVRTWVCQQMPFMVEQCPWEMRGWRTLLLSWRYTASLEAFYSSLLLKGQGWMVALGVTPRLSVTIMIPFLMRHIQSSSALSLSLNTGCGTPAHPH